MQPGIFAGRLVDAKIQRQMCQLDVVVGWVKHATQVKCDMFVNDLQQRLYATGKECNHASVEQEALEAKVEALQKDIDHNKMHQEQHERHQHLVQRVGAMQVELRTATSETHGSHSIVTIMDTLEEKASSTHVSDLEADNQRAEADLWRLRRGCNLCEEQACFASRGRMLQVRKVVWKV